MNLAELIGFQQVQSSSHLYDFISEGKKNFFEQGLPSIKSEDWKYTSLKFLEKENHFLITQNLSNQNILEESADLEFRDGRFVVSDRVSSLGVQVIVDAPPWPFRSHLKQNLEHLNQAILQSTVALIIPANTDVGVLKLKVYSGAEGNTSALRMNIEIGEESKLTLIEDYSALVDQKLVNLVVQIKVSKNAEFTSKVCGFVKMSDGIFYRAASITLNEKASLRTLEFLGGALVTRNESSVFMAGEGATAHLNGLVVGRKLDKYDYRGCVHHQVQRTESHQTFKGMVSGSATGTFVGKIRIEQDAQEVNSSLVNKNLILSDESEINTKPELEIFADNVKASHGATVGQLRDEEVFYLQSRGIPKSKAEQMLIQAFMFDILTEEKTDSDFYALVAAKLPEVIEELQ